MTGTMAPDTSPLRSALETSVALLAVALSRSASALRTTAALLWRLTRTAGRLLGSIASRTYRALDGPVRRAVTGPVSDGLLGRRLEASLLVVLLSPVLALATAWWVGSTVGYPTLEGWVRGTWTGTDPTTAVFLGVALLLALGAASAALNSGLVPTTVLVAGPAFGAAVTRYGTEVTYAWGESVVSLPNAVGVAALLALAFGVPIAVGGFLLGVAVRRVARVLRGDSGPSSRPEQV